MQLEILNDFRGTDLFKAYDIADFAIKLSPTEEVEVKKIMVSVYLEGKLLKEVYIKDEVIVHDVKSLKYTTTTEVIDSLVHWKSELEAGQTISFLAFTDMNFLDCMKDLPEKVLDTQPLFDFELKVRLFKYEGRPIVLSQKLQLKNPWVN